MQGVAVGEQLRQAGFLRSHPVAEEGFKDSRHSGYRLVQDDEPTILNRLREWNDRVDDPLVTVRVCHEFLLSLQSRHTIVGLVATQISFHIFLFPLMCT